MWTQMIVVSRKGLAAAALVALAVSVGTAEPASPPSAASVLSPTGLATTAVPSRRGFSIDPNG